MALSAVIGALRVNLGIDSAAFSNGLNQAKTGLQRFGKLAKTGLLAAGAAAATAAGAMTLAVKGTIDAADEMSKASAKIGVPIEELSRLKYAADLSGVSFEGLQTAVGRLSRVMNDAKNGSKEAVDTFAQLGISATNADGSLKSASQVLQEVSDKFASMPEGAEKTALAMELMGRSGANMIPLLNGGSEALAKLMGEADQFGQVFTQTMGSQAEAFNDNISRLQGAFGNLAARLATELLPYLEQFTNWLVENAPQITGFVVRTVEGFAQFGSAISQVAGFFDQLDASIRRMGDNMRATISSVVQMASELVQAFAAIPGQMMEIGGQIIDGLWQGIQAKWSSLKSSVTGLGSSIVGWFKSPLEVHSPSRVMHEIGVNIMQGLQNGMDSMTGSIKGGVLTVADGISNAFSGVGSGIADAIKGTKSWKDVALDALRSIGQAMLSNMNFGGGVFGSLFKGLLGGLLGFKNGGSFTVGGAGGADSQLVAFRATPGEMVDVHKGGQRAGNLHITYALAQDGFLNLYPEVREVAQSEGQKAAGQVARAVPSMADARDEERRMRRIRPAGGI